MKSQLEKLKMLIFDVDGVMTDGKLIMGPDGHEQIEFFVLDGAGIHLAKYAGYKIALITGRNSKIIVERAKYLEIEDVYINQFYKIDAYNELRAKYKLKDEEISYMGDDVLDIPVMEVVGYSITVPHAVPEVKEAADYITSKPGGNGAVREFIDKLLHEIGVYDDIIHKLLVERRGV